MTEKATATTTGSDNLGRQRTVRIAVMFGRSFEISMSVNRDQSKLEKQYAADLSKPIATAIEHDSYRTNR